MRRAAAVQRRGTVAVRAEGSSGSYVEEQSFRIERVRVYGLRVGAGRGHVPHARLLALSSCACAASGQCAA